MKTWFRWLPRVSGHPSASDVPLFTAHGPFLTHRGESHLRQSTQSIALSRLGLRPYCKVVCSERTWSLRKSQEWIDQLDQYLPRSCQNPSTNLKDSFEPVPENDPERVSQILMRAHDSGHVDILLILSRQGRWKAVAWLVKCLVDTHWQPSRPRPLTTATISLADIHCLSDQITTPTELSLQAAKKSRDNNKIASHNDNHNDMGHAVLGGIWTSLGKMIIEDAICRTEIKPEIMEIIALFHERDIMPQSIYQDTDSTSETLGLLAPHILNALSDVAWKSKHNQDGIATPSLLASRALYEAFGNHGDLRSFHFSPSGLRHQVWLELVLWSCVKGRWMIHGSGVLKYLFVSTSLFDKDNSVITSIRGNLSDQLIATYIDDMFQQLLHTTKRRMGFDVRHEIINLIRKLDHSLRRQDQDSASHDWTARVLQLFGQQAIDTRLEPYMAEKAINLVPSPSTASATILNFTHQILHVYIDQGNLVGALRVFRKLLVRTDDKKMLGLESFYHELSTGTLQAARPDGHGSSDMDQVGLNPDIPIPLLAQFLDLVTEAGAFDFGNWMLQSEAPDKPVIPWALYGHLDMVPALVRFAATSGNSELLSSVLSAAGSSVHDNGGSIPAGWRVSILESHLRLRDWDAADKTLSLYLEERSRQANFVHDGLALCLIARAACASIGTPDESRVIQLFDIVASAESNLDTRTVKTVLAILSDTGPGWASRCANLQSLSGQWAFQLSHQAFRVLLEGIVEAYGSEAGRRLIWQLFDLGDDGAAIADKPLCGDSWLSWRRGRNQGWTHPRLATMGSIRPNSAPFRIVAAKAREERQDWRSSGGPLYSWALARMKRVGVIEKDARMILTGSMVESSSDR